MLQRGIPFYFRSRAVERLHSGFFFSSKNHTMDEGEMASRTSPFRFVYVEMYSVYWQRDKKVRPISPRGYKNTPVIRMCQKRLRAATPKEPLNELYLATMLIALAQSLDWSRRSEAGDASSPLPPDAQSDSSTAP